MRAKLFAFGFALALGIMLILSAPAKSAEPPAGSFIAEEHPEIVAALGDHEFAQGVLDALADSGTNWTELWGALELTQGITWSHCAWLITNMPHLDRLEMSKDTLLEHVRYAYATRTDLPYAASQELFREYILTYRIGDEPVRPWRSEIWWTYKDLVGDSTAETARAINNWVAANLTTRERGFFGPRPDPLTTIAAGSGTEGDIAAVAIAMCKTFGVPARSATVSVLGEEPGGYSWLEIWSDGNWIPMYPDHPQEFGNATFIERDHPHNVTVVSVSAAFTNAQVTSRYTDTGVVKIKFSRNGEPAEDFEHFAVSAWNDGAWLPLDDLGFDLEEERMEAEAEEGFTAVLGDGFYVVQYGVRNARGDAYVRTQPVMVEAGDEIELNLNLDVPVSDFEAVDLVQRTIDPLPEIDLGYSSTFSGPLMFPAELPSDKYTCLVIFDYNGEPCVRMVPEIIGWASRNNVLLIGVGVNDDVDSSRFWLQQVNVGDENVRFYADCEGTIAGLFGYPWTEDGSSYARLPFVILLSPSREVMFLQDGYNLSVADGLTRAIEIYESL
jgi:hypothetical protein